MKKLFLILVLLILVFSVSKEILASSAKSVVETQIEGEGEVYQYVETTVDGETVKKESREPGKLELEMEKESGGEPTVSFTQESTPQPEAGRPLDETTGSFVSQIIEFFRKLFSSLTRLTGLDRLI